MLKAKGQPPRTLAFSIQPLAFPPPYRGRLAPSPTGYLHLGHARTFWIAQQRAQAAGGVLVLRNEDLDATRFKLEFASAMLEDLKWFGFVWQEGPDCAGPFGPYNQSERREFYLDAMRKLLAGGFIYPCSCSRSDVLRALSAPHQGEDEPVYPGTCRGKTLAPRETGDFDAHTSPPTPHSAPRTPHSANWRFRVPDGETISFTDGNFGPQHFVAGKDFGDFVVWRHDGVPAYQLYVMVDDAAMQITEVVRGADLLKSTARQLLLYRALGLPAPQFYHCPLMTDDKGVRLAKRHDALSLRRLRAAGIQPTQLRADW
jgi:glutamyl/glutaminyl-tRNA synthetase